MLYYDQNGALGQFQGFGNATHEYRINNIATNGTINFLIGGSSKFYVANSGNTGISNPRPAYALDVAGDINFTGAVRRLQAAPVRPHSRRGRRGLPPIWSPHQPTAQSKP